MYSTKRVGPRMEPWGTPALTWYCCKDFPSRTTQSSLLLRKGKNLAKYQNWNCIRFEFVTQTSMPNSVKSLICNKCHSLHRPSLAENPSNSIRYNCLKISSWSRGPETILEIIKKYQISQGDQQQKNCLAPFYGWGSTASRLEPLQGGSLLFTTKFLEISGTNFINLRGMKGWVDFGATHWFWTQDPWIGSPAP